MRNRVRRLAVAGCAAATLVTACPVSAAHAQDSSSPAQGSLTFIEALAAVPQAARTLATARDIRVRARERHSGVMSAALRLRAQQAQASREAHDAHRALVAAERSSERADATLDDAARTLYSSGGSSPTLTEVVMTADSELGLARSMVTRQYLASVGEQVVRDADRANEALEQARTDARWATARSDMASLVSDIVESDLASSTKDLRVAETDATEARTRYRELMAMTRVDRSEDYGRIKKCGDGLTRLLARSGFEGENLREAWAIVMRESGGRADAISQTGDLGLFQINTETWQGQDWFDSDLLLKKRYNAQIGYQLSKGGRSWYSWGLDGHGRPDPGAYVNAGWSDARIDSHIVIPYVEWYAHYPCRPSYEKDSVLPEPPPPAVDGGGLIDMTR